MVNEIADAESWDERVRKILEIPARHGTTAQAEIYAEVARQLYVPNLEPDFAFVHEHPFFESEYFSAVYAAVAEATATFGSVDQATLTALLTGKPEALLVFRTLLGWTQGEFAFATELVAGDLPCLSQGQVNAMERAGLAEERDPLRVPRATQANLRKAEIAAKTIIAAMSKVLFSAPAVGKFLKQDKADTREGWRTVRQYAGTGVPLSDYLHQRHVGSAFGQLLNATSGKRGDTLEDAVKKLFEDHHISFEKTGSANHAAILARFGVTVSPSPDFVVYNDTANTLKAFLECKNTSDGGTARDKAMRFQKLETEGVRLGGVPVFAVLSGAGWLRVGDALGPVVKYTQGRVFTPLTLPEMLTVLPFREMMASAHP
jgi:hypothetical protein